MVATQSIVEPSYGPLGLELMYTNKSAPGVLSALLEPDEGRELRQVAMVDSNGRVAAHTGARCIAEAGHEIGEQFSVQANMMVNRQVWPAMAAAYRSARGDLAARMMAAMAAGQEAGGDIRGRQSACILIVKARASKRPWEDTLVDLRVEDHPDPIVELQRLVRLNQAYDKMNEGDRFMEQNDVPNALEAYSEAAGIAPGLDELPFWQAVTLADLGRIEEALPLFKEVFSHNPNWADLVQRLPASGFLKDDPEMMRRILESAK